MDLVNNTLELTPRVRRGLDWIQQGRFREKEVWKVPVSVLDDETRKLSLVKRKALAIRTVLCEMPIRIEPYELIVGCSVQNSVASITPSRSMRHRRGSSFPSTETWSRTGPESEPRCSSRAVPYDASGATAPSPNPERDNCCSKGKKEEWEGGE